MAKQSGKFITLEGIEGAGKTTQLLLIMDYLQKKGVPFFYTCEPGGTEFGKQVRRILLDEKGPPRHRIAELLLYMADRYQHLHEIIEPKLKMGDLVLCDRYHDATIAYQGYGRGIDLQLITDLANRLAIRTPDLTLLFDLDVCVGLSRAQARNRQSASSAGQRRFDNESLAFHERVRQGYLDISRRNPQRVRVIPAEGSIAAVRDKVYSILDQVL